MTESVISSGRGRSIAAYVVLVLCWCAIAWLILRGNPESKLHALALDWAFWLQLAIFLAQAVTPLRDIGEAVAVAFGRKS